MVGEDAGSTDTPRFGKSLEGKDALPESFSDRENNEMMEKLSTQCFIVVLG